MIISRWMELGEEVKEVSDEEIKEADPVFILLRQVAEDSKVDHADSQEQKKKEQKNAGEEQNEKLKLKKKGDDLKRRGWSEQERG